MFLFFCGFDTSSDPATSDDAQTAPLIPHSPPPQSGFYGMITHSLGA